MASGAAWPRQKAIDSKDVKLVTCQIYGGRTGQAEMSPAEESSHEWPIRHGWTTHTWIVVSGAGSLQHCGGMSLPTSVLWLGPDAPAHVNVIVEVYPVAEGRE